MIRVSQLDFSYGDAGFRLRIDELAIATGEHVAIIGPSGSGKTTLLHILAGIISPARGHVRNGDRDLSQMSDAARRAFRIAQIGLVFQEFELLEYLRVLDNILLPYRINSALRLNGEVRRRAATIAEQLGIADKLSRYPHQLSHGEKQRVAICRAILPGPNLILADEPTGNLDPRNKDRVIELLLRCADDCQATLLTVTHDHSLLKRFERTLDLSDLFVAEELPR